MSPARSRPDLVWVSGVAAVVLAIASLLFALAVLTSCDPSEPAPATPADKRDAAQAAYRAQLRQCVDAPATREEADACSARVRARWAAADGGAR